MHGRYLLKNIFHCPSVNNKFLHRFSSHKSKPIKKQNQKANKTSTTMGLFQKKQKNTNISAKTREEYLVNTSGATKVALDGYDPVTFFTNDKPANGNFEITSNHKGATYYFISKENLQKFESNPDKYAPQFGGYCAFGVSVGALFPADITTAQVYKDKLYVNLNDGIVEMFEKDKDAAIAKAEKNWPDLRKKHAAQ